MSFSIGAVSTAVLLIGAGANAAADDLVQYGVCVSCHGAHGEGRPELGTPRIGDLEAAYVAEQLRAFRDGQRGAHPDDLAAKPMVAVARGLNDEIVDRLAKFTAALEPEHRAKGPAAAAGARVYAGCKICHGADARGDAKRSAPSLVFQDASYLARQLRNYRDGRRVSTILAVQMAVFAKDLSDAQIDDVVAYIGSLRPERPPLKNYDVTVSEAEGLKAFEDIFAAATHPRCLNCHPEGDAPLQTEASVPHDFGITRFSPMLGVHCNTCHAAKPVGDGLAPLPPADPIWSIAPKQMVFENRTPKQLCEQLKDPDINGGRGLVDVTAHVREDHLLITSWHMGRPPPPISHEALVKRFETWGAAGGPCPK